MLNKENGTSLKIKGLNQTTLIILSINFVLKLDVLFHLVRVVISLK